MKLNRIAKIGIIGTGFIGKGLKEVIKILPDMEVTAILTQRDLNDFSLVGIYTNSVQKLIDRSELIVECNGDPIYATEVICQVLDAGVPVVTMDAELHITSGTYLSKRGLITEAEGDQPGALAAFHNELVSIGFRPLVYGNLKGFLNLNPTREEMLNWAKKQGISLKEVIGATDGTKIQVEQAFVANGLGAVIARQGLYGYECEDLNADASRLAMRAREINQPISDYLLKGPNIKGAFPKGVFITAEYDSSQSAALEYFKLGEGPYYTLIKNHYLCHLEIPRTIRQVLQEGRVLLDNGQSPTASVCAIAKSSLEPGTALSSRNRAFHVRGEALSIKDNPNHVPIGLMNDVVIKRKIEPGQLIEFDDVEIPDSKAFTAYKYMLDVTLK